MADDKATDEQVFESIVRQWEGGEHANAGKRASLLMQAKPKAKREELEAEFKDRAPGASGTTLWTPAQSPARMRQRTRTKSLNATIRWAPAPLT